MDKLDKIKINGEFYEFVGPKAPNGVFFTEIHTHFENPASSNPKVATALQDSTKTVQETVYTNTPVDVSTDNVNYEVTVRGIN